MNVDRNIQRIREFAKARRLSKSRMAAMAGMRDTVLRNFDKESWNPTAETLRKLELFISESEAKEQENLDGDYSNKKIAFEDTQKTRPLPRQRKGS